jgi:putative transposase
MDIKNPDKEYHRSRHGVFSCQYHVVFTPKFRRPIFVDGIDEKLKGYFADEAARAGFKILEMEVMPDHVHLLLDVSPEIGVQSAVRKLKGYAAKKLREDFPHLKSRLPCIWTGAKFISTVGTVSLEVVKRYIENQKDV